MIGSFPKKDDYFLGGIHRTCYLLKISKFFTQFDVTTFDSTNINQRKEILQKK